jgi:uncharacterized protein (DUF302 family)
VLTIVGDRRAFVIGPGETLLGYHAGRTRSPLIVRMVDAVSSYQRVAVALPPREAVTALRRELEARGITEYAVVDHGADMAAAGAPGFTAWTLVFGNPAAGARVLARDLAAAVDIPLRIAVIGAEDGAELVYRDMRTLLADDLQEIADALTGVLRDLATAVQQTA